MKLLKIAKMAAKAVMAEWRWSQTAGCEVFGQKNTLKRRLQLFVLPQIGQLKLFRAVLETPHDVEIWAYNNDLTMRRLCSLAEYKREDWCFAPDEAVLIWSEYSIPVYWVMDDTWYIPLPDMIDIDY
jgi:hypothetical protein